MNIFFGGDFAARPDAPREDRLVVLDNRCVELIALEHYIIFFSTWTVDIDFCSISDIFAISVLEIVVRLVQAVCAYNCQIGTVFLPINTRVN